MMAWLVVGAAVSNAHINRSLISPILMVGLAAWLTYNNLLANSLTVDYRKIASMVGIEQMSHLGFGDYFTLIFFVSYVIIVRAGRFIVLGLFLFVQFAFGGRADFIFGLASIFIFEFISYGYSVRRLISYFSYVFVILGSVYVGSVFVRQSNGNVDPYLIILSDLEQDSSYIKRLEAFTGAISDLPAQLLFGDSTLIVQNFGSVGAYMHNILSAWQFFGAPFFLVSVVAIIFCSNRLLQVLRYKNRTLFDDFMIIIFIYSVMSILFAKYIGFPLFWFSIGLWLGRRRHSCDNEQTLRACESEAKVRRRTSA